MLNIQEATLGAPVLGEVQLVADNLVDGLVTIPVGVDTLRYPTVKNVMDKVNSLGDWQSFVGDTVFTMYYNLITGVDVTIVVPSGITVKGRRQLPAGRVCQTYFRMTNVTPGRESGDLYLLN
jgi:hypothetical protein